MTAVSRFDMGLVIATDLTIGAFTSLYVAPVIYTYVATAKKKPSSRRPIRFLRAHVTGVRPGGV